MTDTEKGKSDNEKDKKPPSEEDKAEQKVEMQLKIVRMVTVVIYLGAVTGGGTLLSLYYIIFWDPAIQVERPDNDAGGGGFFGRRKRDLSELGYTPDTPELYRDMPDTPDLESLSEQYSRYSKHSPPSAEAQHGDNVISGHTEGWTLKRGRQDPPGWIAGLPSYIYKYPRKLPDSVLHEYLERIAGH